MPDGCTMSAPGQSAIGAAVSFLVMWIVMTAAMMLPALVPMLRRYNEAVGGTSAARLALLTATVSAGYFAVWTAVGAAAYPLSVVHAAPMVAGGLVVMAGAFQFTAWKLRHLAGCRAPACGALAPDARTAWRHGVRLGIHCCCSCAGLTAILLVTGVMDLRAMAAVTAAIAAERLTPAGERAARTVGTLAVAAGLVLMGRAAGVP